MNVKAVIDAKMASKAFHGGAESSPKLSKALLFEIRLFVVAAMPSWLESAYREWSRNPGVRNGSLQPSVLIEVAAVDVVLSFEELACEAGRWLMPKDKRYLMYAALEIQNNIMSPSVLLSAYKAFLKFHNLRLAGLHWPGDRGWPLNNKNIDIKYGKQ